MLHEGSLRLLFAQAGQQQIIKNYNYNDKDQNARNDGGTMMLLQLLMFCTTYYSWPKNAFAAK